MSATSAFIDLSTYSDTEQILYNKNNTWNHFTPDIWVSRVLCPVQNLYIENISEREILHSKETKKSTVEFRISKNYDFISDIYLELNFDPQIREKIIEIGWGVNLFHNLIESIEVWHEDNEICKFNSCYLDYYSQFEILDSKKESYFNLINNNSGKLFLPLPIKLFNGLVMSAVDGSITVKIIFVKWLRMCIDINNGGYRNNTFRTRDINIYKDVPKAETKSLSDLDSKIYYTVYDVRIPLLSVWINGGMYGGSHRSQVIKNPPKFQLTETVETLINPLTDLDHFLYGMNLNFKESIKTLVFLLRETGKNSIYYNGINNLSLLYDGSTRLDITGDHLLYMEPYLKHISIPKDPGYYSYTYSIDPTKNYPSGSTNYAKLSTSVSIQFSLVRENLDVTKKYELVVLGIGYVPFMYKEPKEITASQIITSQSLIVTETYKSTTSQSPNTIETYKSTTTIL